MINILYDHHKSEATAELNKMLEGLEELLDS